MSAPRHFCWIGPELGSYRRARRILARRGGGLRVEARRSRDGSAILLVAPLDPRRPFAMRFAMCKRREHLASSEDGEIQKDTFDTTGEAELTLGLQVELDREES